MSNGIVSSSPPPLPPTSTLPTSGSSVVSRSSVQALDGTPPGPVAVPVPQPPRDVVAVQKTVRFDGEVSAFAFTDAIPNLTMGQASARLRALHNQVPSAVSLAGDSVIFSFPRPADEASGRPASVEHIKMRVTDLNGCIRGLTGEHRIDGRQNMPIMALRVVKDIMGMPDVTPAVSRRIVSNFVAAMREGPPDPTGQKLIQARNTAFTSLVAAIRLGPDPAGQLERDRATVANARPPVLVTEREKFDQIIARRSAALERHDYAAASDAQDDMMRLAETADLHPMGATIADLSAPRQDASTIADDPPPLERAPARPPASGLPTSEQWLKTSTLQKQGLFHRPAQRSTELQAIDKALEDVQAVRGILNNPGALPASELLKQRENLIDRTVALVRAIEAWDTKKRSGTFRHGANTNMRAEVVGDLYSKAKTDLAKLTRPAVDALPGQRAHWSGPGSGFTSPTDHNPRRFQYVINGLTLGNRQAELTQRNPDRYNENPGIISASVISHDKNSVWAYSGFIMEPEPDSLHSFRPGDQGIVARGGREHLDTLSGKFGLMPPTEALQKTPGNQHNELSVVGSGWEGAGQNQPRLRVTGIYVMEDDRHPGTPKRLPEVLKDRSGQPIIVNGRTVFQMRPSLPRAWMDTFKQVSEQRQLPIVFIRQTNGGMAKEPMPWAAPVTVTSAPDHVDFDTLSEADKERIRGNLHETTPIGGS